MPRRLTTEIFLERAKAIHGDKYDYSKAIYTSTKNKIIILCKDHGEFSQTPENHIRGEQGCPTCGDIIHGLNSRINLDEFKKRASEAHGNKYDYSKVHFNLLSDKKKIKIICKEHGEFEQRAIAHMRGTGCAKCGRLSTTKKQMMTQKEFEERVNHIHNTKYDYSKTEYEGWYSNLTIICPTHGEFEQKACKHIAGHGCLKCAAYISKPEIEWLDSLNVPNDQNHRGVLIRLDNCKIRADGYFPSEGVVFEFNGDYWHGNPNIYAPDKYNSTTKCTFGDLYQKTLKKEKAIFDAGLKLVSIWESDWNKKKVELKQKEENKQEE